MKKFAILAAFLVCVLAIFSLIVFSGEGNKENPEEEKTPVSSVETVSPAPTATPTPTETPNPRKTEISALMQKSFSSVSGTCQWGVYTFDDESYVYNASEAVPSASVIKLFIMEYTFSRIAAGELSISDTIEGTSVKTLLENMITVSDNSATNAFIDYYGMTKLNDYFADQGYGNTTLNRRMLDYDAMAAGIENYTSVSDVTRFLKKLYANQEAFPYKDMLDIMKRQQVRTKIPRNLPSDVTIANKTGELDTVENDVGIVFTEGADFAIICLCSDLGSRETARSAISTAAYKLYEIIGTSE